MIITYIHSTNVEDQVRVQLRCRNFADAINRTGMHHANLLDINSFTQNTPDAQRVCSESDILVIYRYLFGPVLTAIQYWKAREKKVIVDFDQAINYLKPENSDYAFWVKGAPFESRGSVFESLSPENKIDPAPLEQFKWGLGMVDAATVTSARLADDWAQHTKIYEVQDFLNTSHYPISPKYDQDEVWIGLAHNSQYSSFINSGLSTAMVNICKTHPQVRLVLRAEDSYTYNMLDIDPAQMIAYSGYEFDEWMNALLKFDIGLAPAHGQFDQRLGPINLLEFMISKIPWVATEQASFHDLAQYGQWIQNTPREWEKAILNVMNHLDSYQKKAAQEPFLFALCQDISANIDKVIKTYAGIINQIPGKGVI